MKFNKDWMKERWAQTAIAICIGVTFYMLLGHIRGIFGFFASFYHYIAPVVLGVILAYMMNPLMKFFEARVFGKLGREGLRRILSLMLTVLFILLIITVLLVSLIPQLMSSVMSIYTTLTESDFHAGRLYEDFSEYAHRFNIDLDTVMGYGTEMIGNVIKAVPDSLGNIVGKSINIGSSIFSFILSFILAIYFLGDKEHLLGGVRKLAKLSFSQKRYDKIASFFDKCNTILLGYIWGDLMDALVVGIINFAFMTIVGMPYSVLISVIVAVTNLAPTFGPIAGAVIGGFILVLNNPWHALWFIIFTIVLQTVDGYIIKPKLFGNALGISSVWILMSIIVLGRMAGIIGVLLAIPFAAIVDFIYREYFLIWLTNKRKETNDKALKTDKEK
ncbi:AI-2E family transporter [Butyrivibrio sp. MC2013]|uniref:AI-2E family transporter n=1 Tax=Butyrivibrio sp. MC2013 TaxID=1280686 RepID=UPI0004247A1C|nr:AI-2E family transporter [Butyrivibrio sp. MC2013]